VADAEILFAAHGKRVFRYLCRIVGSAEANELTQEVFLRVARGPLPQADDAGRRAWIFSIARNLALNHVRDERRRGPATAVPETPAQATQEISAALHEAIGRLAPLDRDVFLMREAGGLSYQEISAACGLTIDAVRSRLHRARQELRTMLGPALDHDRQRRSVRLHDRPVSTDER
jgi:RNA polymerase sigma-70 factor (ECF subfamily)